MPGSYLEPGKDSCAGAQMTLFPVPMRRSHVLLAGVVVVGGIGALRAGHADEPEARIHGAELADEQATFETLAAPAVAAAAVVAPVLTLAEQLDLDHVVRAGDHYEAPLKDGRKAILTLDPDLQELAEQLLDEAKAPRGAIVAMAPDGRVLAMAGRRAEPVKGGAKSGIDGKADWHLATDVWAPAASVFKLVTASALVTAGVDPDEKVCFHGGVRSVMESNLHDDKHDSACESLAFGVAHSNNAILGKLAFKHLAPDVLAKMATTFGLDKALGDVPGMAGAIAIPKDKDLDFAKSAAGFVTANGGAQLTAVGGALLAATFADAGEQPAPRLVESIVGGGEVPVTAAHRVVTAEIAKAVSRMMGLTCDIGSAAKSFGKHRNLRVAGKTGTLTRTEPFYMEHSWFVGYAPAEKPQIVVSVVLGNPENWHLRGQEAAKRMIDRALAVPSEKALKVRSSKRRRS